MKAVMSHQSLSAIGREILIYDGRVEEYVGTDSQKQEMIYLNPTTDMKFKRLPFWIKDISSSAQFFVSNNQLLVVSNFLTNDEKGRKVAYSFFCDSANKVQYTCRLLQDYAILANMELNPADIKAITYILSTRKKIICVIAVFLIILLFIIIF